MDAVFSGKPNSPAVAVQTPSGWAVVQATDSQPPRTPSFEEAKGQLTQAYVRERSQMALRQKTQELADKAHALHNLKDAAKQVGATFKSTDFVSPSQQIPDLGNLGNIVDVSSMKEGEISNAVAAGNNGAVIAVVAKQTPSDDEFAKGKDDFKNQVLDQKRNELLQVYASSLKDKMEKDGKIKIFDKNLARLGKTATE
jgi:peptidyl-prolyl cis-trans isomerase D